MSRALLVIDVQREYFDGAFPVRHPVGHLEAILEVMDAAKKASVPTVVIRHHQPDPESPVFRKGSGQKRCQSGQKRCQEPFFGIRGLPCGRVVISRPSFFVAVVAQVSSPNGEPRLTLRRSAVSSASV